MPFEGFSLTSKCPDVFSQASPSTGSAQVPLRASLWIRQVMPTWPVIARKSFLRVRCLIQTTYKCRYLPIVNIPPSALYYRITFNIGTRLLQLLLTRDSQTEKMQPYSTLLALVTLYASQVRGATDMGPAAFLWPPDRAWGAAQDNTAPCGSSAGVTNRTEFPLSEAFSFSHTYDI